MLRFAVFTEEGPAREWPLVNAHLLGQEDVAVRGEIRFAGGEITCQRRGAGAVALALQYDAGSAGTLVLQTCLLPDSEAPYVLSHELARHRIKTFIAKCEEWQMYELGSDHPAIRLWEEARQLFTKGLNAKDPVSMDRGGRESLEKAIEATERLALAHAEVLLHRRYASKQASPTTLGVRIEPSIPPEAHGELLSKEFDLIYVPLRWRDLEPEEGKYAWESVDRWLSWAQKKGRPVVAGPLIDFSRRALPPWMAVWQHDFDTCRDMVYSHVERVVSRYRSVVSIWSIAAGLNVNDHFQFTPAQMLDLTRMGNLIVRQGERRGRTMLEVVQPFGEHTGVGGGGSGGGVGGGANDSLPPLAYLDRVVQEGIRVDCYGLQIAFGQGPAGLRTRDLMQLSHVLDRFFILELPLLITRIGVPSAMETRSDAGYWTQPWSEEVQARWVSRAFPMAMSKPHVESFFWADLGDGPRADVLHAGLFRADGSEKPVLKRLVDMRRRLRKPLGAIKMPTRINAT